MARRLTPAISKAEQASRAREVATLEARDEALRERARRNADFVQFTRKGMAEYRDLIARSPVAAQLLVLMAEKMDYNNALVCSSAVLIELTGMSRTTVYRAVTLLKTERWLQVIKIGTANAYVINSTVFWTSYGNRKHASFQATILASSAEQDRDTMQQVELRRMPFLRKKEGERAIIGSDHLPPPDQQDLDLT